MALAWSAAPDSDVTTYTVYRFDTGAATWKQVGETAALALTDTTDVLNNRSYSYRVTAKDARGTESTPTAVQDAVLPQKLGTLSIDVPPSATIGGSFPATITALDDKAWRAGWELKVFGFVNLTREVYRAMCERKSGVIINVIGSAGERPSAEADSGSVRASFGPFNTLADAEALVRALGELARL